MHISSLYLAITLISGASSFQTLGAYAYGCFAVASTNVSTLLANVSTTAPNVIVNGIAGIAFVLISSSSI